MNIKPIKIALFLICTLLVLFGLTFISKQGVVKKKGRSENGFVYKSLSLKFPTTQQFLQIQQDSVATLDQVKAVVKSVVPVDDVKEDEEVKDSLIKPNADNKVTVNKKLQVAVDLSKIDTTRIERICYPPSVPNFVENLKNSFNSTNCRIIHYGDSQLEGDRITSYLRNRLQRLYGGSGPGFIPIKQAYHQLSAKVTPSENWQRFALFDPAKEKFEHKKYGVFMSVSRFTPYVHPLKDSLAIPLDSLKIQTASITIAKSDRSYRKFRKFTKIGLHYGNAVQPVVVKVYDNEVLIQQDSLIADVKYHCYNIKLPLTPTNLRIELQGKISPDFYGLTLDGTDGVQIDNVAMRGASGTIFTKSDSNNYAQMAKELNPKLIIMQYGGNTVPYLKDSTAVNRYGNYMVSQINWIKRRVANAQVLFIGPTDMSTLVNGKMETYQLLPYLNKVLKKNCLENQVAYWSMYNAMGGKGSMKLWVDEKMAGSDYTHFTAKGTKIISELLFTSLYLDLKSTLNNQNDE